MKAGHIGERDCIASAMTGKDKDPQAIGMNLFLLFAANVSSLPRTS